MHASQEQRQYLALSLAQPVLRGETEDFRLEAIADVPARFIRGFHRPRSLSFGGPPPPESILSPLVVGAQRSGVMRA
jgi:hypothetical protein